MTPTFTRITHLPDSNSRRIDHSFDPQEKLPAKTLASRLHYSHSPIRFKPTHRLANSASKYLGANYIAAYLGGKPLIPSTLAAADYRDRNYNSLTNINLNWSDNSKLADSNNLAIRHNHNFGLVLATHNHSCEIPVQFRHWGVHEPPLTFHLTQARKRRLAGTGSRGRTLRELVCSHPRIPPRPVVASLASSQSLS